MKDSRAIDHSVRPLDSVGAAIVVALCLSWGLNTVAIKLTLPDVPPLIQATIRSLGALAVVVLRCAARRISLFQRDGTPCRASLRGPVRRGIRAHLQRLAAELRQSRLDLPLSAPFFVALGGVRSSSPANGSAYGNGWLALSFTGMVVAIGFPQAAVNARVLTGDALLIGGGAAWAATTLISKGSRLRLIAPEKTLAYQLLVSVPILAAGAWALGEHLVAVPRPAALWWLLYQTVWVVGVTYAVWFAMVKSYSASRLSAFTFLTPLFGVIAAHFMLGDPIDWPFALAAGLVVGGLILVNRPR